MFVHAPPPHPLKSHQPTYLIKKERSLKCIFLQASRRGHFKRFIQLAVSKFDVFIGS